LIPFHERPPRDSFPLDAVLTSCWIEPVWFICVELWEGYDDARVRIAVMEAVALDQGGFYDQVCF